MGNAINYVVARTLFDIKFDMPDTSTVDDGFLFQTLFYRSVILVEFLKIFQVNNYYE